MNSRMLDRQLKKLDLSQSLKPSTDEQWQNFLNIIDISYAEYETHLHRSNNTLNVATDEMQRLYKELENKTYQQIQTLDSKLKNVMEIAPCFILWINSDGTIEDSNNHFAQMLPSEVKLIHNKSTCLDLKLDQLHDKIISFLQSDLPDISHLIPIYNYHFKITINKNKNQKSLSVIGFDLTEDINKQNKINEIQSKAVYASRMAVLGELAAGVAHEINNPLMILTSVTFLIQRLIEENQANQIPERLEKIKSTIARISRIVNSLRMYARDGELDPLMPVDIEQIMSETLELCLESLKSQSITLTFENLSKETFIINCRDTQISQVILNLISNARDAIALQKDKWIKITIQRKSDFMQLCISDSGPGINPENVDKIFQPFFTTKEIGNGTGLGLSISSGIIRNHNGKFYLDDKSKYTSFVIELPLAKY